MDWIETDFRGLKMLAQNFMTPADLGLNDRQFDSLVKVLKLLEVGLLKYVSSPRYRVPGNTPDEINSLPYPSFDGLFNMTSWVCDSECGTVACIGGTACLLADNPLLFSNDPISTEELFYPPHAIIESNRITTEQAARALRSYLTTGDPKWTEAVA
jgi:hypothetical protein